MFLVAFCPLYLPVEFADSFPSPVQDEEVVFSKIRARYWRPDVFAVLVTDPENQDAFLLQSRLAKCLAYQPVVRPNLHLPDRVVAAKVEKPCVVAGLQIRPSIEGPSDGSAQPTVQRLAQRKKPQGSDSGADD